MQYNRLGRTGLNVSVIGLGAGGSSRLGQQHGKTEAESIAIIHQSLDAGINFIDTAEGYGTEEIVGKGIAEFDRTKLVLSTKISTWESITADDVQQRLEASLQRLGTDYVDVYHLHGVALDDYPYLFTEIVPALQRLRDQGKIRFIGITERFNSDTQHLMLERALHDDVWDVMMVGFNILNQSARERVFAQTIKRDIGTLIMFAVRAAFSNPQRLREIIQKLIEEGSVAASEIDLQDPLGFVVAEGSSSNLVDAAYRFCLYESGVHVTLSGTGSPAHLQANIDSFSRLPLPQSVIDRLKTIFPKVDSVSGQ